MKKITLCLSSSVLLLLFSCNNNKDTSSKLIFSHNAERDTTWINQQFTQEVGNAHSGNRVSVTEPLIPYSLGLHKTLGAISDKKINSVIISAWVYVSVELSSPLKGLLLVASIDGDSKNIYWTGIPADNKIKKGKEWTFVSEEIPLNSGFDQKSNYTFTGYVLNNAKIKILVDDVSFQFTTK